MIETEGVSILRNGMSEWINADSYRAERWAQHELSSACTPPVVAAVLAHIDAQAKEIARLSTTPNMFSIKQIIDDRNASLEQCHRLEEIICDKDEEIERLRAFHEYFKDRCEMLFMWHGMPCIDLYNAAAMKEKP